MTKPISLLIVVFSFVACKKIIHVDLNSASSKIVIEANISDQQGPYVVKLSKTVNFDQSNNYPSVSGAKVTISDNIGLNETLVERSPGTYLASTFKGTAGRMYTISVISDNQTYTSISFLPPSTPIKSLSVDNGFDKEKRVNVMFEDMPNVKNYYRCIEIVNGTMLNDISVDNDEFKDGAVITQTILNDVSKYKLKSGDRVTVLLQSIDKGAFEYFRSLNNILLQDGGGGPPPTAPTNPLSNFSNNALGYFNTYSVTKQDIIIP